LHTITLGRLQLMDQHILDMLNSKLINGDEAYRCCVDKKAFEQYLPKKKL